ncbi:hypothetical protein HCJ76_44160 [Streptomyces sp. MC1]|uniref:hypothetical protein n=1 Tax=Streptomyces sp. MC1 TaxID=295105 RepID=UPI0018CA47F6|nr:hypothetical protein [Streptomyces sp. MC1]MBG7704879.1 hypothetical protein [Streptomyces sp. MC1]
MPAITHRTAVSVADVLTATRPLLGRGWTVFPAGTGRTGSLRTPLGHIVTLDGIHGRSVYATALLPNGGRAPYAGMAKAATVEACAAELAEMIRGTLAPLHNGLCPTQRATAAVTTALGQRVRGTAWHQGVAHAHWMLPSGGRARAEIRPPAYAARHARASVEVTLTDPSTEEAAAVLRAIDTDNADIRQTDAVHGDVAQLLKAAAPGLRPVTYYDRSTPTDRLTTTLTVDDVVTVELAYRNAGLSEAWVARMAVHGAMTNVLAAIRAVPAA